MALEAELALTLKVLGTVAESTLGDVLDRPLHTLRHIHAELQACVSALGPARVWSDPACALSRALLTQHPSAHRSPPSPQQAPGPGGPSAPGCTASRRPRRR